MTGEILGQRKRRRRSDRPRTVVFHWERRSQIPDWFRLRHARALGALVLALATLWLLGAVATRRRRIEATRAAIASVERAAEAFRADHGRCPASVAELVTPPQRAQLAASYLAELRTDGWGRPLELICPGTRRADAVDVRSQGIADGFLATGVIE